MTRLTLHSIADYTFQVYTKSVQFRPTKQWMCVQFPRQPSSSSRNEMLLTMFLELPRILTLHESRQRPANTIPQGRP